VPYFKNLVQIDAKALLNYYTKTMASKNKKALITGLTGQDGSYLAEFLLAKGYEVHGIIRRASTFNTHRIDHILEGYHKKGTKFFASACVLF